MGPLPFESENCNFVEPPSEPREVSLNPQTNSITVSWRRPADLGGRSDLFYQVEHSDPDDFGSYITDTDNLNGSPSRPSYTVTGLRPYTQYCVRVTAHNGVSDQDPCGTHLRTVEECVRADEGGKLQCVISYRIVMYMDLHGISSIYSSWCVYWTTGKVSICSMEPSRGT